MKKLFMFMCLVLMGLLTIMWATGRVQADGRPLMVARAMVDVTDQTITPTQFCARFDPEEAGLYSQLHNDYINKGPNFRLKVRQQFFRTVNADIVTLQRVEGIIKALKAEPSLIMSTNYDDQRQFIEAFFLQRCQVLQKVL